MAARRRPGFDPKAGFKQQQKEPSSGVHAAMLKQARQSGQLNLSSRGLSEVPSAVWRINIDVPEEARNISLDNTEDRWWEQVDLTKLILASNTLTQLSEDIKHLPALTVLDVHDNNLTNLPDALGELSCMQRLNLSHNKLKSLPECVGKLSNLQILLVDHNEMTDLGDHVGNLYHLEELNVSNNQLTSLPATMGFLTRMFKLNVSNNKIRSLPSEIGAMDSLRMLDGTHNQLEYIPEEVSNMRKLEQLYLRHNRLAYLPMLTNCSSLKELHVGNNNIKEISASHLQNLPGISVLDIRDNKISGIPDEIVLLQALERLDLTNNDVSSLPYVLGTLPKLKSIVLDGNPLRSIRRDIVMRGTNELKKYLCSRIEESAEGPSDDTSRAAPSGGGRGTVSGIIGGSGEMDKHTVHSSKSLVYSDKKASAIPDDVWGLAEDTEIKKVIFCKNTLTQWPDRLDSFSGSIDDLDLGFNRLSVIPSTIGSYHRIVHFDLRNNQLSSLPAELSSCQSLREIGLSFNRLKDIPAVLYGLPKLEIILASDNQINVINADGLIRTPQLATLDLQNNDLSQIPPELGNCTQLRSLQLGGNPCRNPRPAILTKGTPAILEYLRNRIPT